jgi:uncharacterized protein
VVGFAEARQLLTRGKSQSVSEIAIRRAAAAALVLLFSTALAAQNVPAPSGPVNDFANVLDAASREQLTALVTALEKDTSAEIAVATVTSLDGLPVDEYANRLFTAWGVGRQSRDNGVLVLVAPADREIRIEVGYGLEGVLPDGLAGAIIREQFLPRFRDGDYKTGIVDGVTRIAAIVRQHEVLTPEQRAALEREANPGIPWWVIVPFMSIFVAIGAFMFGVGLRNKGGFEKIWGGCFGGIPLLLSSVFVPWSFFALGGLALALMAFGYLRGFEVFAGGSASGGGTHDMTPGSWRTSSSGSSPSTSSSWHSSSGSSSSGSSFGGGSSGGGGASGRW